MGGSEELLGLPTQIESPRAPGSAGLCALRGRIRAALSCNWGGRFQIAGTSRFLRRLRTKARRRRFTTRRSIFDQNAAKKSTADTRDRNTMNQIARKAIQ